MNKNETYQGILTIDNIEYHVFYTTFNYSTSFYYRFLKFTVDVPQNIKLDRFKKKNYIRKYQEQISELKIKNILVIVEHDNMKFITTMEDIRYDFIGLGTDDISFNIFEIRAFN